MKKIAIILALLLTSPAFAVTSANAAYNFGDFRSETLTTKAWGALNAGDLEGVLVYTNKCIELYAADAKKMQASLSDFPTKGDEEVFQYWALNDVATSLFIQGEAYRKAEKKDEAIAAYKQVVDEYTYGQAWDTQGWFWKPSEAAAEKMAMLETGSNLDFGDYSSSYLTAQAWRALNANDSDTVDAYVAKILELYKDKAQEMQSDMTEYAWESKEEIFAKWALNDVGTAYFIQGESLKKKGDYQEAKKAYKQLVDNFFYAQCWDANGWFWKPAEAAQQSLDEIGEK